MEYTLWRTFVKVDPCASANAAAAEANAARDRANAATTAANSAAAAANAVSPHQRNQRASEVGNLFFCWIHFARHYSSVQRSVFGSQHKFLAKLTLSCADGVGRQGCAVLGISSKVQRLNQLHQTQS